jgi:hypothetical protein
MRVAEFQSKIPIAALWCDGDKASADMMSLDASRHLWNARVDSRRRTYAAGLYTHVRDSKAASKAAAACLVSSRRRVRLAVCYGPRLCCVMSPIDPALYAPSNEHAELVQTFLESTN